MASKILGNKDQEATVPTRRCFRHNILRMRSRNPVNKQNKEPCGFVDTMSSHTDMMIARPDDFHLHLRDGDILASLVSGMLVHVTTQS
jgi:hypothetical protein